MGDPPDRFAILHVVDARDPSPVAVPRGVSEDGLLQALRSVRDPLLLVGFPLAFALLTFWTSYETVGEVGFDFRGTLWEPARAVLDGAAVYPEPTRAAVVVGNPAVYPPLFIVASVPLALLPTTTAAWAWALLLVLAIPVALRIVGVRDWRCYTVALTWPAVLQGVFWGNLTLLLLPVVALAWRYRDRAAVAGGMVGLAIAAKLFCWPMVVWLAVTRRYRAAMVALGASVVLTVAPWALIGFDGIRQYPELLGAVQDVYAERSFSAATALAGLGVPVAGAVGIAVTTALALLACAAVLFRRTHGDERPFALAITACIVASPIVWPNYVALLIVPVAITWPRLSAAWFLGYAAFLTVYLPKPSVGGPEPCCRPPDVPPIVWDLSHSVPSPWQAVGTVAVVALTTIACMRVSGRARSSPRGSETPPILQTTEELT